MRFQDRYRCQLRGDRTGRPDNPPLVSNPVASAGSWSVLRRLTPPGAFLRDFKQLAISNTRTVRARADGRARPFCL